MSSARNNRTNKRKTPFLFAFSFRFVLVIAALAMVMSYLSVYINPVKSSIPLFFGLYFIPIATVNFLLFIIALLHRSGSAWIPVIVLLPGLLYAETFFKVGSTPKVEKEGIKLKIESYNVGMFAAGKVMDSRLDGNKISRNKARGICRDSVMAHLRSNAPHIACFQEFYVENKRQIDTILDKEYQYRYYHLFKIKNGHYFGNLILSKFPITGSGKISFPKSTNLSIYTDINHYGKTVRVYNNHLESYNISFTGLIKKFNNNISHRDSIGNEIIEVHEKMRGTFIKRTEQAGKILETINESHLPTIICGDFNDTPMSYTYHLLSKGRKDSFKEAGSWFAGTYVPVWPLLRIDYILFPENCEGVCHTTHKIEYSDHYPISAEIII